MDTHQQPESGGTQQGMRLQKSFVSTTPFAPGRRPFFKYRDLGLEAATGGRMRAYQNSSIAGMTQPTGWHYHTCEMQFVYVLKGKLRGGEFLAETPDRRDEHRLANFLAVICT